MKKLKIYSTLLIVSLFCIVNLERVSLAMPYDKVEQYVPSKVMIITPVVINLAILIWILILVVRVIRDYEMVFHNEDSCFFLLISLTLMIVSQIILLGKDLKEEQDLPI